MSEDINSEKVSSFKIIRLGKRYFMTRDDVSSADYHKAHSKFMTLPFIGFFVTLVHMLFTLINIRSIFHYSLFIEPYNPSDIFIILILISFLTGMVGGFILYKTQPSKLLPILYMVHAVMQLFFLLPFFIDDFNRDFTHFDHMFILLIFFSFYSCLFGLNLYFYKPLAYQCFCILVVAMLSIVTALIQGNPTIGETYFYNFFTDLYIYIFYGIGILLSIVFIYHSISDRLHFIQSQEKTSFK